MKWFLVVLVPLLIAVCASASTIVVPLDRPTIQNAIESAVEGDSIVVMPGVYQERINFKGKGVKVVAQGGPSVTSLTQTAANVPLVTFDSGESSNALLSGFSIAEQVGGPIIYINGTASPTVSNNVFAGYAGGGNQTLITCSTDDALITRNIFFNNLGISCVGIWSGSARIINNTFDSNARGFFCISGAGIAYNNIVTRSSAYGISGTFAEVQYNCVWGNGTNYDGLVPGPGSISIDPQFLNADLRDYRLVQTSACINAGHPNVQYNDPDGTRNDIGAIPYVLAAPPLALNLQAQPSYVAGVVYLLNPNFTWQYWDEPMTNQVAYELELTQDTTAGVTPIWQSGQVFTNSSLVQYPGPLLNNNEYYFLRARVFNGTTWGAWLTSRFRTHATGPIHVPEDFPTIQQAIDAALGDDTIIVAPGTYQVNLDFQGKSIYLTSELGALNTRLIPLSETQPMVHFTNAENRNAILNGFTVMSSSAYASIYVSGASPTITNNIFRDYSSSESNAVVIFCEFGDPLISRNLFFNNGGISCVGIFSGKATLVNNTFDRNRRGFFSLSGGTAINNIICRSTEYGIAGSFNRQDYNLVWSNNPDYLSGAQAGPQNLSADPLWLNATNFDYRLDILSPCINAGDPSPLYVDPDGSRNDLGAYPLALDSLPRASAVRLTPVSFSGLIQSPDPTISWTYFDTAGSTQQGFEIEVGTDTDWDFAELWSTGPIYQSSNSVPYEGAALQDDQTYFVRVRVTDGSIWGGWTTLAFATRFTRILRVPMEFPTIRAAVDNSESGDSIVVSAGNYSEHLDFFGREVKLVSEAGPSATVITPAAGYTGAIDFHNKETEGTVVSGFTFFGGTGAGIIEISNQASPTIRDNVFRGCRGEVVIRCAGTNPVIRNNIFYDNAGISCIGIYSGTARILNNTFDGNARGFFSISGSGVAENNCVTNSTQYGIAGAFTTQSYNLVYGNHPDYTSGATVGIGNLSINPQYTDPTVRDYSLLANSPCINAGDPLPAFNDPDGSRSDIGAIPYTVPTSVYIRSLGIVNEQIEHVVSQTPTIAWDYRSPQGLPQSTYQLDIGTNADWTVVETWSSYPQQSLDTAIVYGGIPLEKGMRYWIRLRVSDGSEWSQWRYMTFRLNSPPPQPEPVSPHNVVLNNSNIMFTANAGTDAEGDPQAMEFVLCTDEGLTVVAAQRQGAAVANNKATWNLIMTLNENWQYYWGVRAYDGYEYSDPSAVATFWMDQLGEKPLPFGHLYPSTLQEEAVSSVRPRLLWQAALDPDPCDTLVYEVEMATDSLFLFHYVVGGIRDTFFTPTVALHVNTQYWWQIKATDKYSNVEFSGVGSFWTWMQGDLNLSRKIDLSDLSWMISYLTTHGVVLPNDNIGDLDGNCRIDLSDLSRLAFYMTGQQVGFDEPCLDTGQLMTFTRSSRAEPIKRESKVPDRSTPQSNSSGAQ